MPRSNRLYLLIILLGLGGLTGSFARGDGLSAIEEPSTHPAEQVQTRDEASATTQPNEATDTPSADGSPPDAVPESQPAEGRGRRGRGRKPVAPVVPGEVINVVITGGRILTMDSDNSVVNGTLVIRDGKIKSVRKGAGGGPGDPSAVNVDATGRYVTPGLIDAWSSVGLDAGGLSSGAASRSVIDALNGFDRNDFEQVVRHGVTAVCVEPPANDGVAGVAALVRLEKLDDPTASATADVALVIRLGLGRVGPFGRLAAIKGLREQLDAAKEYKEAWEEYDEELEKYEKDLKSGKTVKLKEDESGDKKAEAKKPTPPPSQGRGRGRRRGRDVDDIRLHDPMGPAAQESGTIPNDGLPRCPRHPWVVVVCCCPEDEEQETQCEHDHVEEEVLPDWLTLNEGGKKAKKKDEKGKDDFSKPERPARDPDQELLVKALKHELSVRIEVHRPADVLSVLELIRAFNLKATISGATGAGYVADELAEAEVPVLLDEFIPSASLDITHSRELDFDNVEKLSKANVSVVVGGGTAGGRSRSAYLTQNAALAARYGLSNNDALRAITINAANACGAADKIGSLEKGKLGDVVVWKGYPLSPDSEVEYVFVGGRQVYPTP